MTGMSHIAATMNSSKEWDIMAEGLTLSGSAEDSNDSIQSLDVTVGSSVNGIGGRADYLSDEIESWRSARQNEDLGTDEITPEHLSLSELNEIFGQSGQEIEGQAVEMNMEASELTGMRWSFLSGWKTFSAKARKILSVDLSPSPGGSPVGNQLSQSASGRVVFLVMLSAFDTVEIVQRILALYDGVPIVNNGVIKKKFGKIIVSVRLDFGIGVKIVAKDVGPSRDDFGINPRCVVKTELFKRILDLGQKNILLEGRKWNRVDLFTQITEQLMADLKFGLGDDLVILEH